jgi:hypothetical protein
MKSNLKVRVKKAGLALAAFTLAAPRSFTRRFSDPFGSAFANHESNLRTVTTPVEG